MSPQIIAAALIAAVGFGSAWQIQSWRMDAREKERAEQELVDQQLSAKAAIRRQEKVIEAVNASNVREVTLRRDAAGSRAALVGLSHAAEQALRDAATSHSACINRATAIRVVLDQCGAAYQELGTVADRHANDAKTLMDAWPLGGR